MRRVIGLSLVGLGTFLIVIAVVLPTFIVGQVTKFPLNEFETATLVASNASYFDAATLTEKSPVNLQATYTIKGDGAAGTSTTAVWNEFSAVNDVTNHIQVELQSRTFAFDRKTAQLVPYSGDSVNGKPTPQTGVLGYVFPINTQKQTYYVYDTSLGKSAPFVYSGTTNVDGIQAYEFIENVTPTQVSTVTVPGSLIGSTASSVTAPEYYSNHLVYDVDPETGALIDVSEHEVQALYNPSTNTQALTLFNADLVMTPASVTKVVGLDNSGRNELNLLQLIIPIILGVVGAVALVVGILMLRQPGEVVEAGPTTPAPEQAAVPTAPSRVHLIPGFDDGTQEATAESGPTTTDAAQAAENAEAAPAEAPDAHEATRSESVVAPEEAAQTSAEGASAGDSATEAVPVAEAGAPAETEAASPPQTAAAPAQTAAAPAQTAAAPAQTAAAPAQTAAAPAQTAGANGEASAATAPRHARRRTKSANSAAEPESGAK